MGNKVTLGKNGLSVEFVSLGNSGAGVQPVENQLANLESPAVIRDIVIGHQCAVLAEKTRSERENLQSSSPAESAPSQSL